jgi:hypothetical protein
MSWGSQTYAYGINNFREIVGGYINSTDEGLFGDGFYRSPPGHFIKINFTNAGEAVAPILNP